MSTKESRQMGKETTTRHKLTSGGYGRWEDTAEGKIFVDYQTGQTVEGLSDQALEFHGDRFDLDGEDTDGSKTADIVAEVLQSRVMDVRPLIQSIDDRPTLYSILDQDRRPKVQGLVRSRIKALPKE